MYALKSYCVLGISAQFSNWLPQDTEGLISSLPTIKNLEFCLIYWSQTLVKVSAPHLIQNTLTCLNNKNSSPRGSTRTDSSAFTHWQAPPNSLSRSLVAVPTQLMTLYWTFSVILTSAIFSIVPFPFRYFCPALQVLVFHLLQAESENQICWNRASTVNQKILNKGLRRDKGSRLHSEGSRASQCGQWGGSGWDGAAGARKANLSFRAPRGVHLQSPKGVSQSWS